jgi:hypothetical protein
MAASTEPTADAIPMVAAARIAVATNVPACVMTVATVGTIAAMVVTIGVALARTVQASGVTRGPAAPMKAGATIGASREMRDGSVSRALVASSPDHDRRTGPTEPTGP